MKRKQRRGERFSQHEILDVWKICHLQEISTSGKISRMSAGIHCGWVGVRGSALCSGLITEHIWRPCALPSHP